MQTTSAAYQVSAFRAITKTIAIVIVTTVLSSRANAQGFLSQVANTLGGAVNTGVHVVTAPFQTVANAAGAAVGLNQPSDIFKPYSDLGRAAGQTLQSGTAVASAPSNFLYNEALQVANIAGQPGQFVFDIATFQQNFLPSSLRAAQTALRL